MAEFKLGRIRFIWKGDWATSTVYYKDDIIRIGGKTYLCITSHTSSALFANDEALYWNTLSDGQEWRGDWSISTYYNKNDIVKYGGYLYICNTAHESADNLADGLEVDLATDSTSAKWDLFSEGFAYTGVWATGTRYKINDIVLYGSTVYICTEEHIAASSDTDGLEVDQDKWEIFSKGLDWKTDWQTGFRYKVNDIVRYGGQIYVCNEGHTSAGTAADGLELDQSKWDYLHKGIEYKGAWLTNVRYKVNDLVKYGGGIWICETEHTSSTLFNTDESNWSQFVEGLEFEDNWAPSKNYQPGDFVTYGGFSYIAIRNNIEKKPIDNPLDWDLFVTGFNFRGDWGDDSSNQEYKVGDVVRLGGFTYLCILTHETAQRPPNALYWDRLNSGIVWKDTWTDAVIYDQGDAVRYGDSSYICILEHTSDETVDQNRPDQDVTGIYWNLLAGGDEASVLTTEGDIVYYGGAGPTRLPVGLAGQVLKVNSTADAPEWAYLGAINNIYYVETNNGVDEPAPVYGTTLDQPWKTIRYATEQVEKGPLRPNARYLIEINKAFIQDEAIEWMNAQILAGTGIWSGFTVDDAAKCRRDMGQIIDALLWDLGHNGNVRTRLAALSYFENGTLITAIQDENEQTAAVIDYMETVIDAVISSVDPAATYGSLTQTKDVTLIEEEDAQTLIGNLIDIITNALTAGVDTDIPAEYKPNDTIFVKTGIFSEVLPISVPEQCAVVGDELRSTRIEPAGSIVSLTDVPYSIAGIENLGSNLAALLSGDNDGPGLADGLSSFSAESIDTTLTVADSAVAAEAAELTVQIVDYINYGINGATGDSTEPRFAGSNTPNTAEEYTQAVEVIEKNRTYLVEEVIGFIAATYPSYTYDEDKCRRDVNRYIDAIKHDLIYTGNYKSLTAARLYVNAVNGSLLEDMFYMRNGTGLRNCTVAGLTGTLGSDNAYGTKRPSAGAFVSLDPGWGPDHEAVWINTKSPYVQNVSTFGTACVGCKIDGDLHNGGNDSIVANDFTQIISDGIGVWCTNLGRTELVSVFSYYGHIGYLAENGGKIRATNGNSSYGTFGTVAEGVDATEVPITGTVNNFAFDAIVQNVLTDGDQILTLEYLNAGVNYTGAGTTLTLTGEGFGATIDSVNTVNGGVFEVRLLDTDVGGDGDPDTGGSDYITSENAAQGGTTTQITLSNTEFRTSGQYIGMAVYIISGLGGGQYGIIDNYNSGTKVADIVKFSDGTAGWDHVTGATIESSLDATTTYKIEPAVRFTDPSGNNPGDPGYDYANTTKARVDVDDGQISRVKIWDPGQGYAAAPTVTLVDPNNTLEAPLQVRIGDGVLTQPTWSARGSGFDTAQVEVSGDGYADLYQPGELIQVENLTDIPLAGSNVEFNNLPGQYYKLVVVRDLTGTGPYVAQFQVSPPLEISEAPEHGETLELRIRYSQVRLTGHDFLDIGTGNFTNTNYPNDPLIDPDPTKETVEGGGGRVFYTSTDQDGNFRVGELFSVEQSTGTATLNADAFNISGLQELTLGELGLGGTGATITEFSTDGTFTADSDNIVPTQKAIKTYITSQIGGGAATLNVNSITAGQVQITGKEITTTTGSQIDVLQKVNFAQGVDGFPVALNYYLTG